MANTKAGASQVRVTVVMRAEYAERLERLAAGLGASKNSVMVALLAAHTDEGVGAVFRDAVARKLVNPLGAGEGITGLRKMFAGLPPEKLALAAQLLEEKEPRDGDNGSMV